MHHFNPIVIVDDDTDDLDLVRQALADIGIKNQQLCFNRAEEALHYLKTTHKPTFLILSDLNMPVLGGLELKKQINKDDILRKQSIPFIYLSTSCSRKEVEIAYQLMVQGFFEKPSSYEELKNTLKVIFSYWLVAKQPLSK